MIDRCNVQNQIFRRAPSTANLNKRKRCSRAANVYRITHLCSNLKKWEGIRTSLIKVNIRLKILGIARMKQSMILFMMTIVPYCNQIMRT